MLDTLPKSKNGCVVQVPKDRRICKWNPGGTTGKGLPPCSKRIALHWGSHQELKIYWDICTRKKVWMSCFSIGGERYVTRIQIYTYIYVIFRGHCV